MKFTKRRSLLLLIDAAVVIIVFMSFLEIVVSHSTIYTHTHTHIHRSLQSRAVISNCQFRLDVLLLRRQCQLDELQNDSVHRVHCNQHITPHRCHLFVHWHFSGKFIRLLKTFKIIYTNVVIVVGRSSQTYSQWLDCSCCYSQYMHYLPSF